MKDGSRNSKDVRNRPQTPQDFTLLKAIRYEDAENGIPPVPVATINPPKPPSSSNSGAAEGQEQVNSQRPRTSPSPRAWTSPKALYDGKRDSGFAPSVSTLSHTSYAESNLMLSGGGIAKVPSLPTIKVQDDEGPSTVERNRLPFKKSRKKDEQTSLPSQGAHQRIESFKGIQSDIPSGSFGDIDLEDLATDKVGFSHRGSLMFGGKKMDQLLESQGGSSAPQDSVSSLAAAEDEQAEQRGASEEANSPKQGLAPGRRKPSVHMLQAALQGGRVLSAEEITFSMKVRSMYEHGDERAAEGINTPQDDGASKERPESSATNSSTPDPEIDGIVVGKTRQDQSAEHPAFRTQPATDVRASYHRESSGPGNTIEDWEDVDGRDVDRYGFINAKRPSSGTSARSHGPGEGVQRVATSLRVEADRPRGARKLRRGPSITTRSSRSVPPKVSSEESSRVGSLRSYKSNTSIGHLHSGNPFRSKDRRTLTEASDMLTLPPGLADIAEQEDSGKSSSTAKRRELAREEKWQKMARPIRGRREGSNEIGGGMQFEFDPNDQKVVNRTWKGIPDRWRASAWHSFLSSSAHKRGNLVSDEDLIRQFNKLQAASSAEDVQIDMDVPRTINMHIMFRRRYRGGQRLLFRVLHAISLYFPDTGYVQGMASLAATLLCYYDEESTFVMMVRLWQLRGLEQLFQSGFGGLMSALNEFEKDWLRDGDVARKLEELGITSTAYGTRWYLTLFNMSIPFPAQLRVWDAFMLLGDASSMEGNDFGGADLDVLHATSAALIDATREIILDSDFENAMKVLTSFVPIKDEDLLMRVTRAEWKMRKKRGGSKA